MSRSRQGFSPLAEVHFFKAGSWYVVSRLGAANEEARTVAEVQAISPKRAPRM
jgi:hypothetical protein